MNFANDYDWQQAFAVSRVDGASSVDIDDVATWFAASGGVNDGPPWLALFQLKDGRYGTIEAGCDYTGWGCQDYGVITIADNAEDALNLGLNEHDRVRLLFNAETNIRTLDESYYRHPDLYVTMKASI